MTARTTVGRILSTLEYLVALARHQLEAGEVDFETLAAGYIDIRRALAKEFRQLAEQTLAGQARELDVTRARVEHRMQERWGGRLPDKFLVVRGYGGVHPILLEYLIRHVGVPVPASRLRLLTGDQVHTERRLRELRDLGYDLTWTRVFDEDDYVLHNGAPDLDAASKFQATRNIRGDRSLNANQRDALLAMVAT